MKNIIKKIIGMAEVKLNKSGPSSIKLYSGTPNVSSLILRFGNYSDYNYYKNKEGQSYIKESKFDFSKFKNLRSLTLDKISYDFYACKETMNSLHSLNLTNSFPADNSINKDEYCNKIYEKAPNLLYLYLPSNWNISTGMIEQFNRRGTKVYVGGIEAKLPSSTGGTGSSNSSSTSTVTNIDKQVPSSSSSNSSTGASTSTVNKEVMQEWWAMSPSTYNGLRAALDGAGIPYNRSDEKRDIVVKESLLKNVTSLSFSGHSVDLRSILRAFPNLRNVDLSNCGLSDLSELAYCPNLESVNITNNHINDLSPLRGLGNLKRVDLWYNYITDFSAIANRGVAFDARRQGARWAINAKNFPNTYEALKRTFVDNNLQDAINEAERTIYVYQSEANQITIIDWTNLNIDCGNPGAFIHMCPNIQTIKISQNKGIGSLQYFDNFKNLSTLIMDNCSVSDLSPLAGCNNLRTLSLLYNNVLDISPISHLPISNLNYKYNGNCLGYACRGSREAMLRALNDYICPSDSNDRIVIYESERRRIKKLDLSNISIGGDNIIGNILKYLTELEELNLSGIKGVAGLVGLEQLTNLKVLNISNNNISDISPLDSLPNLRDLTMNNNKITRLPNCPNLINLQAANNQLNDIVNLGNMTKLQSVNLNNQRFEDLIIERYKNEVELPPILRQINSGSIGQARGTLECLNGSIESSQFVARGGDGTFRITVKDGILKGSKATVIKRMDNLYLSLESNGAMTRYVGDCNLDGIVTNEDAVQILRISVGISDEVILRYVNDTNMDFNKDGTVTQEERNQAMEMIKKLADVDENGKIGSDDALEILKLVEYGKAKNNNVGIGETYQFFARVEEPNTTNKKVKWSAVNGKKTIEKGGNEVTVNRTINASENIYEITTTNSKGQTITTEAERVYLKQYKYDKEEDHSNVSQEDVVYRYTEEKNAKNICYIEGNGLITFTGEVGDIVTIVVEAEENPEVKAQCTVNLQKFATYIAISGAQDKTTQTPEKGDANADGMITRYDALLILKRSVGLLKDGEFNYDSFDVDGDGNIGPDDALDVLKKVDSQTITIQKGKKITLRDNLDEEASLRNTNWSSSDEEIATVFGGNGFDEEIGLVDALPKYAAVDFSGTNETELGTVGITATSEDGCVADILTFNVIDLQVSAEYSNGGVPTNEDVVVTLTANNEIENYTSSVETEGWIQSQDKKRLTKVLEDGHVEELTLTDSYGITKKYLIQAEGIDKEVPVINEANVVYSTKERTNQDVVVTISTANNEDLKPIDGWTGKGDGTTIKQLEKVYTEPTTETIVVMDVAGNSREVTISTENIDKEGPTIQQLGEEISSIAELKVEEKQGQISNIQLYKEGELQEFNTNGYELIQEEGIYWLKSYNDGYYTLKANDDLGNESEKSFVVVAGKTLYISTAEELRGLGKVINEGIDSEDITVKLSSDIDLQGNEWTPIGTAETPFKGNFDGRSYTISGLSIDNEQDYQGLFGVNEGTIQNVIVEGSISANNSVGGIAGKNTGEIKNCINKAEITGAKYVGGIAGQSKGSDEEIANIINCGNNGNIYARDNASGGIVGGCVNTIIASCYEKGNIRGKTYIGGIVGTAIGEGNIIRDCYTGLHANIRSQIDAETALSVIGGIVGNIEKGTIEGVYFAGDIVFTAKMDLPKAAIVGRAVQDTVIKKAFFVEKDNYVGSYSNNEGVAFPKETIKDSLIGAALNAERWESDNTNINHGYPILHWELGDQTKPEIILTKASKDWTSIDTIDVELKDEHVIRNETIHYYISENPNLRETQIQEWKEAEVRNGDTASIELGNLNHEAYIYIESGIEDSFGNATEFFRSEAYKICNMEPEIKTSLNTEKPSNEVQIKVEVTNLPCKQVKLAETPYSYDNGDTWVAEDTYTVLENKTYCVMVKDEIGNIALNNIEVSNLDKEIARMQIINPKETYYENDSIDIKVTDNFGVKKVTLEKQKNTNESVSVSEKTYAENEIAQEKSVRIPLNEQGQYDVKIEDVSNNIATYSLTEVLEKSGEDKKDPTYTVPKGLKATEGDTLADVKLPKGFAFEDDLKTSVGKVGTNTFKVTYTPEDTINYKVVKGIEVQIAVEKAEGNNPAGGNSSGGQNSNNNPSGGNSSGGQNSNNNQTGNSNRTNTASKNNVNYSSSSNNKLLPYAGIGSILIITITIIAVIGIINFIRYKKIKE